MQVVNAKVLVIDVAASIKDAVIARGLHIAFGDEDVFVDVERVRELDSADLASLCVEVRQILDKAFAEGCHYIHMF